MSSAIKQLKASARTQGGKGAARAVRRANRIPAVIYGGGEAPQPISLDQKEAQLLIFAGHFLTTLFEIEIDGKKQRAIPRDYQLDPVKDTPLHIDFLRLKEGQKIRVEVPVHVINQDASPGVKRGGAVNIVEHSVLMMVPADAIPSAITVDLKGIDINHSIHINNLTLPAGCTPVDKSNFTLVTVVAPSGGKDEPAPAAAAPAKK
jgi:large subunit ribosomal protein L25